MRKTLAFSLLLIVIALAFFTNTYAQTQLSVNRLIQVYPGFVVVNDTIKIPTGLSSLTVYLTSNEYSTLYSVHTIPNFPIQWGPIKGSYIGFTIALNGFQGNLTVIRVYDDRIFQDVSGGEQVNMFAYFPSDLPIAKLNATVKFTSPVSNINPTSPKGATQKFVNGVNYIVYNATNLNAMNTTLLTFSFNPASDIPWVKISSLNRTIIVDNLSKVTIVDSFLLQYVGRNQTVTSWVPYLLPNATVVNVRDDLGTLTYTGGSISLRYPLLNTYLTSAFISNLFEKVIVTSEINLTNIGTVDQNKQRISLSLNALQNNYYIIDNLTLTVSVKYPVNVEISPTPDNVIKHQDGIDYIYVLHNVDPTESFKISLNATINPYVISLDFVDQILAVVAVLMFIAFAYTRFAFRPTKEEITRIPELPRFVNLMETLILDNEEMERLDQELERGTIKKQDYTVRINNLRRNIESKESDFRSLANMLTSKYPETKQIINELNNAYSRLIKAQSALREARNAVKTKKMQQDVYKRTVDLNMRMIRDSRAKIDSILNQLKERYLLK